MKLKGGRLPKEAAWYHRQFKAEIHDHFNMIILKLTGVFEGIWNSRVKKPSYGL